MTCPKCKREIPDDALLCCYCGRQIVKKPQPRYHQRGNGTGTAYRRGKTWTAVVVVGWTHEPDGSMRNQRRTKGGFATRAEALEYCAVLKNGPTALGAPQLEHYWQIYERDELTRLSNSKQCAYRIAWRKLQPIAKRAVDTLTVEDLRGTVQAAAPTYYPARDMKVLLSHLFRLAGADRAASKELPEFIVLPPLDEKERTPFSDLEQAALWRIYDAGDRRAALPLVMIYTGMMPGEAQGLRVDMIDVEAQVIRGAGLKTKVRRESPIYLPDVIVPVLIDEIAHAESKVGYLWPHSSDRFYGDYYGALEAAGCRRLEPYCCRHTTATALAITEGIAPQTVRKVMRWSSTRMLDRYAHPDDRDAMSAVNRINR